MLCIHISRDYFISTNKDDYARAEAGNYQKEIPKVNENQNNMDDQTQPRRCKTRINRNDCKTLFFKSVQRSLVCEQYIHR